jgi:hypothetical protein
MNVRASSASQVVRTTAIPAWAVLKVGNILQCKEKQKNIWKIIIENLTDNLLSYYTRYVNLSHTGFVMMLYSKIFIFVLNG